MDLGDLAADDLDDDVGHERRPDPDRDAERQRHEDHPEQGRQALLDVAEVDVLDQADHQEADEDQHRRRRHVRHEQRQRREQDRDEEQEAGHDRREPGPATLGDAGRALDVARVRADPGRAADGRGDRVDEQDAADVLGLALLVDEAGLLADRGGRAHRVEEVGEHEAEDRQDGREQRRGP